MMGNKHVQKKKIEELMRTVCNNQGVGKSQVKMKNVAVIHNCGFNLFSLTKRLREGCTMMGDYDSITMEKIFCLQTEPAILAWASFHFWFFTSAVPIRHQCHA